MGIPKERGGYKKGTFNGNIVTPPPSHCNAGFELFFKNKGCRRFQRPFYEYFNVYCFRPPMAS